MADTTVWAFVDIDGESYVAVATEILRPQQGSGPMPVVRDFKLYKSGTEVSAAELGDQAVALIYGELDDKAAVVWLEREEAEKRTDFFKRHPAAGDDRSKE